MDILFRLWRRVILDNRSRLAAGKMERTLAMDIFWDWGAGK